MTEKDWQSLVWALRNGNCVLVLGDEAGGPAERARRDELTQQLKKDLRTPAPDGLELPQIAWLYQNENSRNDLRGRVETFYAGWKDAPLDVHAKLAGVPFHCIVTSCQDGSMEGALEKAQRPAQAAVYEFKGTKDELTGGWTHANPLLYYLFGDIRRPASLVLTEHDLVEFVVAIVSQNPAIPESLRAELRDADKMFLFLGFGVRHWYPRVLLQVLKSETGNSRSFALEQFPQPADLARGVFFYRQGHKVEVFDSSVAEFVDALVERSKEIVPAAKATRRNAPVATTPPPDGLRQTVFICHDHDDAALADRVAKHLADNGVEPWLDKRSLDIGVAWKDEIQRRINDVDYFLMLVTPALTASERSVAFQELKFAQERLETERASRRFILPLVSEGATMLEELMQFHMGPVRGEQGEEPMVLTAANEPEVIKRVALSIKRDAQRRLKKGA